ncbi:hypothetical protein [Aidingimonas halophila]|uniref:Uncharacterized protein n=1 Tax=Aidingimonas halophila TaxID=574349 RepID=A0A1H3GIP0_9GAMM|nr:hypothetical protein [Aidingimonas halophila]GHC33233.1 hypothetical protein GCM10008094_27560 [Aidingimonas halophila]SDY02508.1 hypothetical protein SAMN05443545_109110 [Aidingimonas halophila]
MLWISENASAITAIGSILTFIVWLAYMHLLYKSYSRQRRPRIIINRGRGMDIDSLCLISNMSVESIFVQHIVAVLETADGNKSLDIIDYKQSVEDGERYHSHQGPLESGGYLHVDTFRKILKRVAQQHGEALENMHGNGASRIEALDIRVIAIYGSEDSPVGASRRFLVNHDGNDYSITPAALQTQRLTDRRSRRQIQRWMQQLEM